MNRGKKARLTTNYLRSTPSIYEPTKRAPTQPSWNDTLTLCQPSNWLKMIAANTKACWTPSIGRV